MHVCLMLCVLQRMSDTEFSRRVATGTLHSSNVAAQTITKLSSDPAKAIKRAKVRQLCVLNPPFSDCVRFTLCKILLKLMLHNR